MSKTIVFYCQKWTLGACRLDGSIALSKSTVFFNTKLTFCESRIDFVRDLSIVILKKRGLA